MTLNEKPTIKIAILDLYEGVENQGMRGLRQIIKEFGANHQKNIYLKEFDIRSKNEFPSTDFDIYISSGGPGSPIETMHQEWDINYMNWISQIDSYNQNFANTKKKHVFFICHSFQLAARYYNIGTIAPRKSTAFGIFPIHLLEAGKKEPVFQGMHDPFYAVDSRDFQVIQPNAEQLSKLGAQILCIEKERPHVPYERAIMAVRFNEYFIGTQFHPEADAIGMSLYLQREDKKEGIIKNYGLEKWQSMLERLNDPDKIYHTYHHILPNFLKIATGIHQKSKLKAGVL